MARQVPAAPPALLQSSAGRLPGFQADLMPSLQPSLQTSLRTSWLTDFQTSRSNFKCYAQNFLHDLTSGSSCGTVLSDISVTSPGSSALFCLPSLVRVRVPRDTQASRWASIPRHSRRRRVSFHPGRVRSHCAFSQSHAQFCSFRDLPFRKAWLLI